jgi:ABC-2 type transport system permease protein
VIGKIIGTSLAGILQFFIWVWWSFIIICGFSFLWVNVGPGVNYSTRGNEPSASEFTETAQIYLKELWNLPITAGIPVGFLVYFIGGYFYIVPFYAAIGAAVDNQTDSQQFFVPIIMP